MLFSIVAVVALMGLSCGAPMEKFEPLNYSLFGPGLDLAKELESEMAGTRQNYPGQNSPPNDKRRVKSAFDTKETPEITCNDGTGTSDNEVAPQTRSLLEDKDDERSSDDVEGALRQNQLPSTTRTDTASSNHYSPFFSSGFDIANFIQSSKKISEQPSEAEKNFQSQIENSFLPPTDGLEGMEIKDFHHTDTDASEKLDMGTATADDDTSMNNVAKIPLAVESDVANNGSDVKVSVAAGGDSPIVDGEKESLANSESGVIKPSVDQGSDIGVINEARNEARNDAVTAGDSLRISGKKGLSAAGIPPYRSDRMSVNGKKQKNQVNHIARQRTRNRNKPAKLKGESIKNSKEDDYDVDAFLKDAAKLAASEREAMPKNMVISDNNEFWRQMRDAHSQYSDSLEHFIANEGSPSAIIAFMHASWIGRGIDLPDTAKSEQFVERVGHILMQPSEETPTYYTFGFNSVIILIETIKESLPAAEKATEQAETIYAKMEFAFLRGDRDQLNKLGDTFYNLKAFFNAQALVSNVEDVNTSCKIVRDLLPNVEFPDDYPAVGKRFQSLKTRVAKLNVSFIHR